jgi:hypothetical protein
MLLFKKTLCIASIVLATCSGKDGSNGKDGVDGLPGDTGRAGKDGKDGSNGKDGANGKDGLDNRFKEHVFCQGVVLSGFWKDVHVTYSAYETTAGDVLSHASVRLGVLTQAASNSYSSKQVGSLSAPVFVPLSDVTTFIVKVDRVAKVVTVEVLNPTQPDNLTFDADACEVQTY